MNNQKINIIASNAKFCDFVLEFNPESFYNASVSRYLETFSILHKLCRSGNFVENYCYLEKYQSIKVCWM